MLFKEIVDGRRRRRPTMSDHNSSTFGRGKLKLTLTLLVCLFKLRFYSPINALGSCRARSINLFTLFLDRLINRNKALTAKLLRQGYRYFKLRKAFSKYYRRHSALLEKI